jgi:flavin reductase (DIM6/NTAB) family NADH-FMN oxidoreductase RutF/rubredoxin
MNMEAFLSLTYGLYIVSTHKHGRMNGYIGNTVFQVTADPAQLAISCSKKNYTAHMLQASKTFAVSVLEQDASPELIGTFGYKSGKDVNKFGSVQFKTNANGLPIVTENAIAYLECNIMNEIDIGSHILFIGKVMNSELLLENKEPLTYSYYREVKKGMSPQNAPTYIDAKNFQQKAPQSVQLKKYRCQVCNYVYDPENGDEKAGIAPGTGFEDLPRKWTCPICGVTKEIFQEIR